MSVYPRLKTTQYHCIAPVKIDKLVQVSHPYTKGSVEAEISMSPKWTFPIIFSILGQAYDICLIQCKLLYIYNI